MRTKHSYLLWFTSPLTTLAALHRVTLLLLLPLSLFAGGTFDFVVETSEPDQLFICYINNAADITIQWGDGTLLAAHNGTGPVTNQFAVAGRYTNQVSGVATRIAFGEDGTTPALLVDITSRMSDGVTGINSAYRMFKSAVNITQFSQEGWFDDTSPNVTTLYEAFHGANKFNDDIGQWDVGKVTSLYRTFSGAAAFNCDIGGWTVSNVTTLRELFYGATAFNQDIGDWNVSKVNHMAHLFHGCKYFNQDIGRWNVGKVTNMALTFYNTGAFNQDIGDWDVSNVTTMDRMFASNMVFAHDISGWDVSKVSNFNSFFPNNLTYPTEYYNQLWIKWSRLNLKSNVTFNGGKSKFDDGLPAAKRQYIILKT